MAANDTISDMLTRIRNANLARHQTTEVPSTKMTRSIAKVLQAEGFIVEFSEVNPAYDFDGRTSRLVAAGIWTILNQLL